MIWAVLAMLGVPLWLIAICLLGLFRARSKVKSIPGTFALKARSLSGTVPGMKQGFTRYNVVGQWVHDVLVLHGGSPFLLRTTPHGIAGLEGSPVRVMKGTVKHVKTMEHPELIRVRLDSGAIVELVCARKDEARVLGPLQVPAESARTPA